MDLPVLLDAIDTGGTIGVLAWLVIGAMRVWWVAGKLYTQAIEERDLARAEAREQNAALLEAVSTAEVAVGKQPAPSEEGSA